MQASRGPVFQSPTVSRCRDVPSDPEEVLRPRAAHQVRVCSEPCSSVRSCRVHFRQHHPPPPPWPLPPFVSCGSENNLRECLRWWPRPRLKTANCRELSVDGFAGAWAGHGTNVPQPRSGPWALGGPRRSCPVGRGGLAEHERIRTVQEGEGAQHSGGSPTAQPLLGPPGLLQVAGRLSRSS